MAELKHKSQSLLPSNHTRGFSDDTLASVLAESAISYSAFPEPPSSIPTTPTTPGFSSSPPFLSHVAQRKPINAHQGSSYLQPFSNRFSRSTAGSELPTHESTSDRFKRTDAGSVSLSALSPHDWHEGASSIDVDAAEDRLLPTSFITSLLQENAGSHNRPRLSGSGDAVSGISEMTYPPNCKRDPLGASATPGSSNPPRYRPLPRPTGARPVTLTASGGSPRENLSNSGSGGPILEKDGLVDSALATITERLEQPAHTGGRLASQKEIEGDDGGVQSKDSTTNASSGLASNQSNLAQIPLIRTGGNAPHRSKSTYSSKTVASSLVSRIPSLRSLHRGLPWKRKPLPPVPTIPHIPLTAERQHRRLEEGTPLPDLIQRAERLHGLLEKGYHPHNSVTSHQSKPGQSASALKDSSTASRHQSERSSQQFSFLPFNVRTWSRKKIWIFIIVSVLLVAIIIGVSVGVTVGKSHKTSCPRDLGGARCDLNATCVCTTTSTQCNPVAQSILDLIPVMNAQMSTNITTRAVFNSIWIAQGAVVTASCIEQVDSIDVSSVLDAESHRNRTTWARVALLWTLIQTQDPSTTNQLQKFLKQAPWSSLPSSDGPVNSSTQDFAVTVAGYKYDFAAQTITPSSATFISQGQPLEGQIARVDPSVRLSLDRMYSYAVASSTQRDNALTKYWTNVLHQHQDNLRTFIAAFSASKIILPFDGTSRSLQTLYNTSNTFPPPLWCYSNLSRDQRDDIMTFEKGVFELSSFTDPSQVDSTCFSQHPIYGVLDVLHLRLPFLDSRRNVARQGVVLKSEVSPRAILAVGEYLSALPGQGNVTRSTSLIQDPRSYGTTAYANHVILHYLSSMPVNAANAVADHVLRMASSIPVPPSPDQQPSLFPLESIPLLEVAVFGNVEHSDVDSDISSFTTPSGSLFFGSKDGSAFRTWVIGQGGTIMWTENATSPEIVSDETFSDLIFNQTWNAASIAIGVNATDVGVANITNSFRSNGLFHP